MRIHREPFDDAKGIAEYYVRCLPRDTCQTQQSCHCLWHLTTIFGNNALAGCANILCFIAVKTRLFDILLQLFRADLDIIFGAAIFLEKLLCHHVNPLVSALCRQLCGYEEFEWVREVEGASGVWVKTV